MCDSETGWPSCTWSHCEHVQKLGSRFGVLGLLLSLNSTLKDDRLMPRVTATPLLLTRVSML